jgi:predicted permease
MFTRDLVYAARTLRKSPVFTATAMLTIALGIGASTAIFSVTNAVLLRPLPYKDPDRLAFVISDMRQRNVKDFPFADADFLDLRNQTTAVFEEVAAVRTNRTTVPREDGTPEQVRLAVVSTNFFRTMGANVERGRTFTDSDGQPQAAPPPNASAGGQAPQLPAMIILSHHYWQRRFGGSPDIIGKPLPGGRPSNQIVGVLAPGFELLFPFDANMEQLPDFWVAARIAYDNANRNTVAWRAIGRLRAGTTVEQAQSSVDRVATGLRSLYTIKNTAGYFLRIEPMHRHIVEDVRPALLTLMGAVIFLLLIACANVANLLLVRASLRERELAVRTALGGNWWQLLTQMFAEALLLAIGGGAAGVALAAFGIGELRAIAPASLPRLDSIAIDPMVIAFAVFLALVAAAIFGTVPAWRAARPNIANVLRSSGRTAGLGSAGWLRNAVVVAEVALCFVLLIGSGLMFRSFLSLQRIEPGFDAHNLLTFQLLRGGPGQSPPQRAARQRTLHDHLMAIPGVQRASAGLFFPLTGGYSPIRWGTESSVGDPSKFQAVDFQLVLPGYIETMGTPLLAGRTFTDADNAPERNVVIIDQVLTAKAFPGENAIGKRIQIRVRTPEPEWVEVIGVVAHVRATSLAEPGREQIYFTDGFLSHGAASRWALRTAGNPAAYSGAVRSAIADVDRNYVITEMQPASEVVSHAQSATRFQLLLIGVFAGIAALLAGVGLYGVLATVVRQRTAEIGVRMALGAAPGAIFGLVVGQGLRLSAIGIAAGLAAALALTRVMTTMLIGVKPTDPLTFGGMVVLFAAIATFAAWLPARRAASLDPTVALRDE